jgi:hypothetical protein
MRKILSVAALLLVLACVTASAPQTVSLVVQRQFLAHGINALAVGLTAEAPTPTSLKPALFGDRTGSWFVFLVVENGTQAPLNLDWEVRITNWTTGGAGLTTASAAVFSAGSITVIYFDVSAFIARAGGDYSVVGVLKRPDLSLSDMESGAVIF